MATVRKLTPARLQSEQNWFRLFRVLLTAASWLLLAGVLAHWILIRFLGDVWWVGTVALFAPRWMMLVPVAVIASCCAVWLRSLLLVNIGSALLLIGPVMGYCVPMPLTAPVPDEFRIRFITVNAGGASAGLLQRHLEREVPDVVAFQEFGRLNPADLLDDAWHWQIANGTVIASRYPIEEYQVFPASLVGRWGDVGVGARLKLPVGDVWVYSLHLNTPRWGLECLAVTRNGVIGIDDLRKNTQERDIESKAVRQWIAESNFPSIVAGDFNMPVESRFYRRDWARYQNAFSAAGWGLGHTKFTRRHGVRIDHILASDDWQIINCHVGGAIGGDHAPVVADLVLSR